MYVETHVDIYSCIIFIGFLLWLVFAIVYQQGFFFDKITSIIRIFFKRK